MRIYTKTGDSGTTSLIGGERASKADPRVEAYGTVDELAAHLALLADMIRRAYPHQIYPPKGSVRPSQARKLAPIADRIDDIQHDLMALEAIISTGGGGEEKVAALPAQCGDGVRRLERLIDEMSEGLPPLKGFTIPGGHPIVSQSHICRTVCRRAERAAVRAAGQYPLPVEAAGYLNRLSDYLYVVGRKAVDIIGVKETYWIP